MSQTNPQPGLRSNNLSARAKTAKEATYALEDMSPRNLQGDKDKRRRAKTLARVRRWREKQQAKQIEKGTVVRLFPEPVHKNEKTERNAEVIAMRGEGASLQNIAEKFGISVARASQLSGRQKNKTGHRGVAAKGDKFQVAYKGHYIGLYATLTEAAAAYAQTSQ